MTLSARIPKTLEAKGWALYRAPDAASPHPDLVRLVSQGRSRRLALGVGYCILPLAQRDDDPDDVLRHQKYALKSRQCLSFAATTLAKYPDRTPRSIT